MSIWSRKSNDKFQSDNRLSSCNYQSKQGLLSRFKVFRNFSSTTTTNAAAAGVESQQQDSAFFQESNSKNTFTKPGYETAVGTWLFGIAGMCFGMIVIGGYTRLSGSGLSMTSWKFQGQFLPCGRTQWEREFEIYKETPEYKKLHYGTMDLDEFKQIFFVEWFHRMWGRLTGLSFALPLVYFLYQKALTPRLGLQLGSLFLLGISQAFVGWWMVRSGFVDPKEHMPLSNNQAPRVSAYRLTTHLAAALTIYSGLIWTGMQCITTSGLTQLNSAHKTLRFGLIGATGLVLTTILSGGFVAGNDAGCAYNTWPKMLDDWIPNDVKTAYQLSDLRMFTENTATVQFNHRLLAYTSLFSSLGCAGYALGKKGVIDKSLVTICGRILPIAVTCQVTLGIMTLLNCVPISYGVAHQAGGVGVLTTMLIALARLRK